MRMARKFRNKGFEVTCPAEFSQGRSGGTQDLVFWVRIPLGEREYLGVLDTGATISIVAKKILPEEHHDHRRYTHGGWTCGAQLRGL